MDTHITRPPTSTLSRCGCPPPPPFLLGSSGSACISTVSTVNERATPAARDGGVSVVVSSNLSTTPRRPGPFTSTESVSIATETVEEHRLECWRRLHARVVVRLPSSPFLPRAAPKFTGGKGRRTCISTSLRVLYVYQILNAIHQHTLQVRMWDTRVWYVRKQIVTRDPVSSMFISHSGVDSLPRKGSR